MAADLTFGSVPPFYREVYEILCPSHELQVDRDIFIKLLVKTSLPSQTLSLIWDQVDNKQGYLTRTGLYKALALTALAQQGKQINEKLLETFSGQELPKPLLGDLSVLKSLSLKLRREKNPTHLGMTYQEICSLDTINVEIIPEKKGLFLKHVEYEVTSETQKSRVRRRYNDFIALHELLLLRYPYRSIPRLPPKKMMGADAEFIEERRRALKRYLMLICRHPVMTDDQLVTFFLTFSGQDAQTRMRETFRNIPDEYIVSDLALKAKDLVPLDTHIQFASSREQIRQFHSSVSHMKEIVDRLIISKQKQSQDMLEFGKEISLLSVDKAESAWATGGSENWFHLKKSLRVLNKNFTKLYETLEEQSRKDEDGLSDDLNLLVDLLTAYKDLCERHEKGVQTDHQRALSKMMNIKRRITLNSAKGPNPFTTDQLENRILEHENEILSMENRNYFALHCIHMETQLIHTCMEVLHQILQTLSELQMIGHSELTKIWDQFLPTLSNTFVESTKSPVNSRPTSPINDY